MAKDLYLRSDCISSNVLSKTKAQIDNAVNQVISLSSRSSYSVLDEVFYQCQGEYKRLFSDSIITSVWEADTQLQSIQLKTESIMSILDAGPTSLKAIDSSRNNQLTDWKDRIFYNINSALKGVAGGGFIGFLNSLFSGGSQTGEDIYINNGLSSNNNSLSAKENYGIAHKEGKRIKEYIDDKNTQTLFGQYNYTIHFLSDIKSSDMLAYSAKNWKETFFSMLIVTPSVIALPLAGYSYFPEMVSNVYIDNEDKCKAIVKEIVDNLNRTDYLDILSSDQERYLKEIKETASRMGYKDTSDLMGKMEDIIGDVEKVDKIFKDYTTNITMLESIKRVAGEGTKLDKVIDDLISDYKNQAAAIFSDVLKDEAKKTTIDVMDLLGTKFGKVDSVLQTVLGDVPELDSIDTVIFSNQLVSDSCTVFSKAAEAIKAGDFSAASVEAYKESFNLAKALKITEYEAMKGYYEEGSKAASFLGLEISKLKTMTYDNFQSARNISDFGTISTSASGGGTGSFGYGGGVGVR